MRSKTSTVLLIVAGVAVFIVIFAAIELSSPKDDDYDGHPPIPDYYMYYIHFDSDSAHNRWIYYFYDAGEDPLEGFFKALDKERFSYNIVRDGENKGKINSINGVEPDGHIKSWRCWAYHSGTSHTDHIWTLLDTPLEASSKQAFYIGVTAFDSDGNPADTPDKDPEMEHGPDFIIF